MLKDTKHLLNAPVDEDSTNERFKDIAHNFTGLKDLDFTIVHLKVLFKRVADVAVEIILFACLHLLLFILPVNLAVVSCS